MPYIDLCDLRHGCILGPVAASPALATRCRTRSSAGDCMRLPMNSGWWGRRSERRMAVEEAGLELPMARTALLAHLRATEAPASETERVREAVRDLCDDAHRRHLQAEQLLIAIKGAWRSMPESRSTPRSVSAQNSLDRFISLCIEEFYIRRD